MVYSATGEQRLRFRVHNSTWKPVDLDGICLMKRPLPAAATGEAAVRPGFSKAAKQQFMRKSASKKTRSAEYILFDLETTGLRAEHDHILEFGAIRVQNEKVAETFSCLVYHTEEVPEVVAQLTGLCSHILTQEGVPIQEALPAFLKFIGNAPLVGFNPSFDLSFLRHACSQHGLPLPANACTDLLPLARRKIFGIPNYKLSTLAEYFELQVPKFHRALSDCFLLFDLQHKLKELG